MTAQLTIGCRYGRAAVIRTGDAARRTTPIHYLADLGLRFDFVARQYYVEVPQ